MARRSLFLKYAAYLAVLVSTVLMASGALAGYFAYRSSIAALEAVQRERAHAVATQIVQALDDVRDAVERAAVKFAGPHAPPDDDIDIELVGLLRHQPALLAVRWADGTGQRRVERSRLGSAVDDLAESGNPERADARDADHVAFHDGTDPVLTMVVGDKGGPVVTAATSLRFVGERVAAAGAGAGETVYVVDREGRLLSHPDPTMVLARTDLHALPHVARMIAAQAPAARFFANARSLDGRAVVATAFPVPGMAWTVFIETPRAAALAPVYDALLRSALLMLVGVAIAVGASVPLARRMVQPIREIASGARAFGAGRLDSRIRIGTRDELEELGDQFNRMADQLASTYASLDATIAIRTRELERANQAKSRLLAAASHDLRQPMHALSLFVEQLRRTDDPGERAALVARVERSVGALGELLDALLDLSQLDVGAVKPELRAFALQPLLRQLGDEFAPLAEEKGLALIVMPNSLWVRSDPLLLSRILRNLLANAVRYTASGCVLVGCRRHADVADIVVIDTGIGIAEAELPRVFDEFHQVPGSGRPREGLGLGLAIVQRLAALLGHEVRLASVPGRGTCATVAVPRATPGLAARTVAPATGGSLEGVWILVVDDDAAAAESLAGLLRQWDANVDVAADTVGALASVGTARVDLVLCDLRLAAGANGLDVLARLKGRVGATLPCAIITGEQDAATLADLRARGYPVVRKPAAPAMLRAVIASLLADRVSA